MQNEMTQSFLPKLNAFTEQLKEAHLQHAAHVEELTALLKDLKLENDLMRKHIEVQSVLNPASITEQFKAQMQQHLENLGRLENHAKTFGTIFQNVIDDTNLQLGMLATHWGGYLEQIGVHFMLNTLKADYGVHTSFQKFKRFWQKTRNVEIDLLALSDTTAYVVEVKNQLKEASLKQMLTTLEKIKEKVPEYSHLKIQPVFVCIHAEDQYVKAVTMANLWVVRYKGFDRIRPIDSFEWLRKDE
jgi:hypothetical protein